jgi:hypothetical protein
MPRQCVCVFLFFFLLLSTYHVSFTLKSFQKKKKKMKAKLCRFVVLYIHLFVTLNLIAQNISHPLFQFFDFSLTPPSPSFLSNSHASLHLLLAFQSSSLSPIPIVQCVQWLHLQRADG